MRTTRFTPVMEWLINGEVGESSKTMAAVTLGVRPDRVSYPHDPDDFNRCLLLISVAPVVRDAMPRLAKLSKVWAALIEHWEDVEKCFLDEVGLNWSKGRRAKRTWDLMRVVIENAR